MRHQVVDDDPPVADADLIHLEEAWVKKEVKHLPLPRLARVLVAAQARQHLRADPEARQVVSPA